MKLLSIIVPCLNEEDNIETFYNKTSDVTLKLSDKYNFEFIFIDDGSTDKTLEVLQKLADMHNNIRFISFTRNFGKEAAMYAGLKSAKGDMSVFMDVDGQDPPNLLPEMLQLIESGYDTVATRRVSRKGEPFIRSLFSRIFYYIINKMSDVEILQGTRDYRIMTKQMADSVLSLCEYHRFSKGLFAWVGYKCKYIEYDNTQRTKGDSKWSPWSLLNYAIEGIVSFSTIPLRLASIMGLFVSISAVIYILFIMIRTMIFGIDVPGYASLLTVSLFIGGMMLFSIGMLGEYMSRTYIEVKKRPIFLIKESSNEK